MPKSRPLPNGQYANSRALIIGINRYKKAPPLSYAVNDALGIREVLIDELAFPAQNVTCLIDADASRSNILRSFLTYAHESVGPDERIVVFFAGHGHTRAGIRGPVGYLVPHDADMTDLSTLLRWDEFTRNSVELIHAKHIFFIMDACYGGLALKRNGHTDSSRFVNDMMRRCSRQVLTAGKADEVVSDSGGPLPGHSVFTGHLIEGLRGKALNRQGFLIASVLMSYVYDKVSNDPCSEQTPHFGHIDGDGDMILLNPRLGGGSKFLATIADDIVVDTLSEPDEFSVPAKNAIREAILKDARTIAQVATAAKLRVQGDAVSRANVEEALIAMKQPGKKSEKLAGAFGGILLGASLSTLLSMILDGNFGFSGTVIALTSGVTGAFLVALHMPEGILSNWFNSRPPR